MRLATRAKLSIIEMIAFGPWKHLSSKFERPGVTKEIKRKFNRRTRRQLHVDMQKDIVE